MKQVFDFEQFTPPVLNERLLRRELEKRAERWRIVLLAVTGALFQAVFILLGLLCWNTIPALALACIGELRIVTYLREKFRGLFKLDV